MEGHFPTSKTPDNNAYLYMDLKLSVRFLHIFVITQMFCTLPLLFK